MVFIEKKDGGKLLHYKKEMGGKERKKLELVANQFSYP